MMKILKPIALLLVIVGGINWGLVGLFNLDVVAAVAGTGSIVSRVIYVLVGVSALLMIWFSLMKSKK